MSKTYIFQDPYYTIEVPVTTAICAAAIFYCAFHAIRGDVLTPPLMLLFMTAAIYQVWNALISRAYPRKVTVDDDSMSFSLFGRTDRYAIDGITEMKVRANPRNGGMFVRINDPSLFRGRYWLNTKYFSDGRELFDYIEGLEMRIHPQGLKARARNSKSPKPRKGVDGGK